MNRLARLFSLAALRRHALLLALLLAAPLFARTSGNFTYEVFSNGEASVTDFSDSYSGALIIPSTLGGYPVTSISGSAFSWCSSLTSVEIPKGVTSIGSYAFYGCRSLTSVVIPEGVTSIGNEAFYGCSALTSLAIPEGVTSIGNGAFEGCSSLSSVEIPDGVTSISNYVFYGCRSLTSVTIPEGVTSIGNDAFNGCRSLTSVVIPEGVTSIGDSAFQGCSSLTSVTIPEGVTSIGSYAFSSCTSLVSMVIPPSVRRFGDNAFSGVSLETLEAELIPSSMSTEKLTSVRIPDGVKQIGWYAFKGCSALKSVTIPDSVTFISGTAFRGCSSLPKDDMGVRYESVEKKVIFSVPTSYSGDFTIPDSVRFIQAEAFSECTSLTAVEIPNSVVAIGYAAFSGCTSLKTVTIPDSVISIETETANSFLFARCTALTSVVIGDNLTDLGLLAFEGCTSLTSIVFGNSIEYVGLGLNELKALTSVVIGNRVTYIDPSSFAGLSRLNYVVIGDSVVHISESAFEGCESLSAVTIPKGVTFIGSSAFSDCSCLDKITFLGKPCEAWDSSFPVGATGVYPAEYSAEWEVEIIDGMWHGLVMIRGEEKEMLPAEDEFTYEVVAGQVSITGFSSSYAGCLSIPPLLGGYPVASIGDSAFSRCSSLTSVTIPACVTFIGDDAFAGCSSLLEIQFEGGVPQGSGQLVSGETRGTYRAKYADMWTAMLNEAGCWRGVTMQLRPFALTYANLRGATHNNPKWYAEGVEYTFLPPSELPGYTFLGWTPVAIDALMTGNQVVTATWQTNNYVIAYNANGGTGEMECTSAIYDQTVTLLANGFAREGYIFTGWATEPTGAAVYTSGAAVRNLTPEAEGTVTLYAVWEGVPYTIIYVANGGAGEIVTTTATYGEIIPLSGNGFFREGYTFTGWAMEPAGAAAYAPGEEVTNLTAEAEGTVTLYAAWEANRYAIAYNANGGEGEMASTPATYDQAVALAANTFTRAGYTFTGWATEPSGAAVYAPGEEVTNLTTEAGGAVTLYAAWEANRYAIAYNANGGTGEMAGTPATYDQAVALAANGFLREGYTFIGWATEPAGAAVYAPGEEVTNLTAEADGTVTLCAAWKANRYAIAYNANGGEGEMTSTPATYDQAVALAANGFLREGYTFKGWATTSMGTVVYEDRAEVRNLTAVADGTVTFYAVWEGVPYAIAYNANGGLGDMVATQATYGEAINLSANAFTREGYTFKGWATSSTGTVAYGNGDEVRNLMAEAGGVVMLYAIWEINHYTIAYNANGGEGVMESTAATYGEAVTLRPACFTRAKYLFKGWALTAAGEVVYGDGAEVRNLTDEADGVVTLYAVWEKRDDIHLRFAVAKQRFPWNGVVDVEVTLEEEGLLTAYPQDYTFRLRAVDQVSQEVYVPSAEALRLTVPTSGVQLLTWDVARDYPSLISRELSFSVDVVEASEEVVASVQAEAIAYDATVASRVIGASEVSALPYSPAWAGGDTVRITINGELWHTDTQAGEKAWVPEETLYYSLVYETLREGAVIETLTATVQGALAQQVATPVLTIHGDNVVLVTSETEGAILYYTVDGSEPTDRSPTVFGPLLLSGCGTLKVRAMKLGWIPSGVATYEHNAFVERNVEASLIQGSVPWQESTLDGTQVWQSGSIGDGGTSSMLLTLSGPGTLTFRWKVSSESGWDWLSFLRDGNQIGRISGTQDWQTITYSKTDEATATFTWHYTKDGSVSNGRDCGWVDAVMWLGANSLQVESCPYDSASRLYYVITNSEVTILSYAQLPEDGHLMIPAEIVGLPVTTIDDEAFTNCTSLTSVTIPNSVTTIGENAFSGVAPEVLIASRFPAESGMSVEQLTTVVVPAGTETIAAEAFAGCSALTSVTLPASVKTFGSSAFRGCSALMAVAIPEAVTTLGDAIFADCTSLASVTLPEGITAMSDSMFSGCAALTAIEIPASVKTIRASAFADCTSLATLTIPDGVTSVGSSAFAGCTSLTSVTLPNSVTTIGENAFSGVAPEVLIASRFPAESGMSVEQLTTVIVPEGTETIAAGAFAGCSALTSVTLPASVTAIRASAFRGCSALAAMSIPEAVTTLENAVFADCTSLASVTLPAGITEMSDSMFSGCVALTAIEIPASVKTIGASAFAGCISLPTVTIPEGVTSIGASAFGGCTSLTSVTLPNSVTTIGENAFSGVVPEVLIASRFPAESGMSAERLTTVIVPEGMETIAAGAFAGCSAVTSVVIPASVTEMGEGAFTDVAPERLVAPFLPTGMSTAKLTEVTLTTAATVIADEAFAGNTVLRSIVLPAGVTSIGARAFAGCSALERVTIPSSVTEIGAGAFRECTGLTEVVFAEGLVKVGDEAFWGCSAVEEMVLPASLTTLGRRVFTGCNRVLVAEGNRNYKSVDGVLFSANDMWLWHFPIGRGGEYATPKGVSFVGEEAFMGNTALTQVYLTDIVTIGTRAFQGCSALRSCFATEGLTTIEASAFESATSLGTFTLPASVTKLQTGAFANCPQLNSVVFRGGVPERTGTVFSGMDINQAEGRYLEAYSADWTAELNQGNGRVWDGLNMVLDSSRTATSGDYTYSIEGGEAIITGTITTLPNEVVLPMALDGYLVTGIGAQAFKSNTNLTAITFPRGLRSIGNYAFRFCKLLQSVTFEGHPLDADSVPISPFPSNTTAIGSYPQELESVWRSALQSGYYYGLRMGKVEIEVVTFGKGSVRGCGTYYVGTSVTLEAVPAKGQRFVEWELLDEAGTTSTENPFTFTVDGAWVADGSFCLMATFEKDPDIVVFWDLTYENLMGATHTNPASYRDGSAYTFEPPSVVLGYTFLGWQPSSIDASMAEDLVVRASWQVNNYTVSYHANGGEGAMENSSAVYDTPFTLRANAFTRSGYIFQGWATAPQGEVCYADGAEVSNLTGEADGTVTLYAVWLGNAYTIAYNANGGEGVMESTAATYGEAVSLRPACFTRAKYLFKGWALTAAGEVVYGDGAEVRNLTDEADGVVTLYAVWEKRDDIHLRSAVAKQRFPWNGVVDIAVTLEEEGLLTAYPQDYTFRLRAVDQVSQEVYVPSAEALRLMVPTSGVQLLTWDVARDYPSLISRELSFSVDVVEASEEVVASVQAEAITYDATVASRVIGASEVSALPYSPAWSGGDTVRITINGELWHTDTQAGEKAWVPEETLYYSLVNETLREGAVIKTLTATVQGALAQQVATPVLTIRGDNVVLVTSETEGAILYYTVDGSEPTEQSPTVTNFLVLSGAGTLKVRAMKLGWIPSEVASYEYEGNVETLLSQGSVPWQGVALEGTQVWQSGAIGHDGSSTMSLSLTGPGKLTFRWKVSSESGWDWLSFLRDGNQIGQISGTQDWQTITYSKTDEAAATFTWQYTKDGSVSNGRDCGWVDAVMWTGAAPFQAERCPYDSVSQLYYVLTNSEVTILSYAQLPEDGHLELPAAIAGAPVAAIADYAFANGTALSSVTLPATVRAVGEAAFLGCTSLTSVTFLGRPCAVEETSFPDGIVGFYSAKYAAEWETTIEENGYWNGVVMAGLAESEWLYTLSDGQVRITGMATNFTGRNLIIPSSLGGYPVTSIGDFAFSGCSTLTSVELPNTLRSMGESVFWNCTALTSVTIPGSLTAIGKRCFRNCTALASVTIEEGVKAIETQAFQGCPISTLRLPTSLEALNGVTFLGCECLETLTLPANVSVIDGAAFCGCTQLKLSVDENNPNFSVSDNILFDKTQTKLASAFAATGDYVVPEGIQIIGDGAFYWGAITSVVIPASVTTIKDAAFNCDSLTQITFLGAPPAALDTSFYEDGEPWMSIITGCYLKEYADDWKAVIEEDRTWHGLAMACLEVGPSVEGDEGATIEGSAEEGWVVKPSEGVGEVVVSIPEGVEAAKVTVEVPSTATSVTANGATIKVVKVDGDKRYDITDFLDFTKAGEGTIDLSKVDVQAEIAEAILDMTGEEGASFDPSAEQPLTTAPTKPGLIYILLEGASLDSLEPGESKVGDGQPWTPTPTTKRGSSAFYRIRITK